MRILLHSIGNVPARFVAVSSSPENYIIGRIGDHEVLTFGYSEGVDIQIKPEDDFKRVVEKMPPNWRPDLCILWSTEWYLLPKGIEDAPFPIVVVEMDLDYDVPLSRTIVQSADLVIAAGEFEKESILSLGAKSAQIYYSQGIMKEYIHERPNKISERPYDIFYSTLFLDDINHPDRSRWILKLSSLSDKYKVFIRPNPDYTGYIEDLRKAKLAFSYNRFGSMSVRFLEAGGQGTIIIEPGTEVKRLFEPGKEYIAVDEDNIIEQIEAYLGDGKRLQEMSERVYEKVVNNYEARTRFLGLIEFAWEHLKNTTLLRPFQELSESEKALRRGEVYYYASYRTNVKAFFVNIDLDYLLKLSIEEFKRAVSLKHSPRAMTALSVSLMSYGGLLFKIGKKDLAQEKEMLALSLLEDVISHYPSYVMAWFNLGLLHFRRGYHNKAEEVFRQTLKLFRDKNADLDPWVLHNRDFELFNKLLRKPLNQNLLLLSKGEKEKAIENIRVLYEAVTLYFLSILEEEKGRIYESLESLVESYNLYPHSGIITRTLASRLAILGYKEEALNLYKKSLELLPLDMAVRVEYINLLYLYGMDRKAMNEIKETFRICKTVSHLTGNIPDLNNTIQKLRRLDRSSYLSHDLAIESLLNGWIEELHKYLRKNPSDFRIVLRTIELFMEIERVNKAIEMLEDYLAEYKDKLTSEVFSSIEKACNSIKKRFDRMSHAYDRKFVRLHNVISDIKTRLTLDGKF